MPFVASLIMLPIVEYFSDTHKKAPEKSQCCYQFIFNDCHRSKANALLEELENANLIKHTIFLIKLEIFLN